MTYTIIVSRNSKKKHVFVKYRFFLKSRSSPLYKSQNIYQVFFFLTEDGTSTEKAPFLEPSVEVGPPFPSTKSEKATEEQEPEDKWVISISKYIFTLGWEVVHVVYRYLQKPKR